MITKEQIEGLVKEQERAQEYFEKEMNETKDCTFAFGLFMAQCNVAFLKEALEGKVDMTKQGIQKQLRDVNKIKDSDAITSNSRVACNALGRVTILKEILDRFYTVKKSRVSRKQRIATTRDVVEEARKVVDSFAIELRLKGGVHYTIHGETIACQHCDSHTAELNGEWCTGNIHECLEKGNCFKAHVFAHDTTKYLDAVADLDAKNAALHQIEQSTGSKIVDNHGDES